MPFGWILTGRALTETLPRDARPGARIAPLVCLSSPMGHRTKTAATPDQEAALQLLEGASKVLLTGHERPDGDCLGAQVALSRVLTAMGKSVTRLNPDPPEVRYDFLAEHCPFPAWVPGEALPEHDLCVVLDCSELTRTGPLFEPLEAAPSSKLVIDHHVHEGDAWCDAAFVDETCAATGLLVHRIAKLFEVELDMVAAMGVFTSLVADTGWFRYGNTDSETLSVAAELVAIGVQPDVLFREIFQNHPPEHPSRVARMLSRVEYFAEGRLALADLPLSAGDASEPVDTDDVHDLLRSVGRVEVVLLLQEVEPEITKLSARSKSGYNVAALARHFGGGGHRRAAGATIRGSLAGARQQLLEAALAQFGQGGKQA